jgi:hypothetical protein
MKDRSESRRINAFIITEALLWIVCLGGFVVFVIGFLAVRNPAEDVLNSANSDAYDVYSDKMRPCFIAGAVLCMLVATIVLIAGLCHQRRSCAIGLVSFYPLLNLLIIALFAAAYFVYDQDISSELKSALQCNALESVSSCESAATKNQLEQCFAASPSRYLFGSFASI